MRCNYCVAQGRSASPSTPLTWFCDACGWAVSPTMERIKTPGSAMAVAYINVGLKRYVGDDAGIRGVLVEAATQ